MPGGPDLDLVKGLVIVSTWGDYRRTVIDYDCDYFAFCDYDYDYSDL